MYISIRETVALKPHTMYRLKGLGNVKALWVIEMVDRCIAHGVLEHSFDNFHFKCRVIISEGVTRSVRLYQER